MTRKRGLKGNSAKNEVRCIPFNQARESMFKPNNHNKRSIYIYIYIEKQLNCKYDETEYPSFKNSSLRVEPQ